MADEYDDDYRRSDHYEQFLEMGDDGDDAQAKRRELWR